MQSHLSSCTATFMCPPTFHTSAFRTPSYLALPAVTRMVALLACDRVGVAATCENWRHLSRLTAYRSCTSVSVWQQLSLGVCSWGVEMHMWNAYISQHPMPCESFRHRRAHCALDLYAHLTGIT
eukprot:429718-Pelagomonas_calceolata.AAC.7